MGQFLLSYPFLMGQVFDLNPFLMGQFLEFTFLIEQFGV